MSIIMFSKNFKTLNLFNKRFFTSTLNPEYYKSKKVFNLEKQKIFNRNWIPIGYTSELNNNTILAKKFGNVEIFITKSKDGEIKTFYNTCRHRASRLIRNDCNKKTIICLHSFTNSFGLDNISISSFIESKQYC